MPHSRFEIEGGHPIAGSIRPSGNKNAALPLIAATLLTEEEVVLHNLPSIRDVATLTGIVEELGVSVQRRGPTSVAFRADGLNGHQPDPEACSSIRASILLAGPLLARHLAHLRCAAPGPHERGVAGTPRGDAHDRRLRGYRGLARERERPRLGDPRRRLLTWNAPSPSSG